MKKLFTSLVIFGLFFVLSGCKKPLDAHKSTESFSFNDVKTENVTSCKITTKATANISTNFPAEINLTTNTAHITTHVTIKTTVKSNVNDTANEESISFEEGKKSLAAKAETFMKENGIDPSIAGETGETCSLCGKKIWNAHKFGLGNPGHPSVGYGENSPYCTGGCGIVVN